MRLVVLLAFDDCQILDVTGPAAVFGSARDARPGSYDIVVASADGRTVRSSCGVSLATSAVADIDPASVDLLLVAGGGEAGLRATVRDATARDWVARVAAVASRYGSVCSGAFILAAWGLLDGRRVATHWSGTAELARRYPALTVDPLSLFVEQDRVWTSAGVTTGIDMSLAIVERDHGAALATAIARRLVLHARRSGHQSQFSDLLAAQTAAADGGYADLVAWIGDHLDARLDVDRLATRAGQSPRSFHRHFTAAMGKPPAAYVTARRLDRARAMIEAGTPIKRVASACGFATPDRLTKAFRKTFGLSPAAYRAGRATSGSA